MTVMSKTKFKIEKYGGERDNDGNVRTSLLVHDKATLKNVAKVYTTLSSEYLDNINIIVLPNEIRIIFE